MVGLGDLGGEIELGGEDFFGEVFGEMALVLEARALGGRRAGDDDYGVEMPGRAGFIKQRNIDAKPVTRSGGIPGQRHPAVADGGVEDVFEFTAFGGVIKDQLAQHSPVRPAFAVEYFRPKDCPHRRLNGVIMREQIVRALVSVEKLRRQVAPERSNKG